MAGESARDQARRSREKAARLLRYAEMYERGAEGEERTAAVLNQLPSDWTVLHDVGWPGRRFANIDHIVVGPPGVFVIDSKNWSGRIEVVDSVLRQNGRSRETAVAGCADSALAVSELIPQLASCVVPVLCFVREEPIVGWARDVAVCSEGNLLQMLTSRQPVLSPDWVAWGVRELDGRLRRPGGRQAPSRGVPHRRSLSGARVRPKDRSRSGKSRRRSGPSAVELVVKLMLLVLLVVAGPRLITTFTNGLSKGVVTGPQGCPTATHATGKTGHDPATSGSSAKIEQSGC